MSVEAKASEGTYIENGYLNSFSDGSNSSAVLNVIVWEILFLFLPLSLFKATTL